MPVLQQVTKSPANYRAFVFWGSYRFFISTAFLPPPQYRAARGECLPQIIHLARPRQSSPHDGHRILLRKRLAYRRIGPNGAVVFRRDNLPCFPHRSHTHLDRALATSGRIYSMRRCRDRYSPMPSRIAPVPTSPLSRAVLSSISPTLVAAANIREFFLVYRSHFHDIFRPAVLKNIICERARCIRIICGEPSSELQDNIVFGA